VKVCVYGLWHLGSVTAACLASVGHTVVGLDMDENAVDGLQRGKAPLLEPGLDALLQKGISENQLWFTADSGSAPAGAEVIWVTFDTPVDDEDRADVNYVLNRIMDILPFLDEGTVILVSSQMPVGSLRALDEFAEQNFAHKRLSFACSPENLRLGKALDVFLHPDRIVVGVRTALTQRKLEQLLLPVTSQIEWMAVESAEMTKHAINAFLATSVTFANEIAAICEVVGADAKEVERGMKTESRIGHKAYLSPGGPFAGGTLARDVAFLGTTGKTGNLETPLLSSISLSNDEHKQWVRRKLLDEFRSLSGVIIAVWGLTYKPGTNTLRRSLAVELCDWLLEEDAELHVYDPVVSELPERWNGRAINHVQALDATAKADVLIVGTDWPQFRQDATSLLSCVTPDIVVIDANRYLANIVPPMGLKYITVGTPWSA
jgi:UDPglucose 6-dehydrogenase